MLKYLSFGFRGKNLMYNSDWNVMSTSMLELFGRFLRTRKCRLEAEDGNGDGRNG